MLRALVLVFLVVNAALYWWLHSDLQALQADREPQRLGHQVSPDAIQVLPDLPASSVQGAASAAAASAQVASDADATVATGAASTAATLAHKTSETDVDCAETPPLDDAQFASLKAALAKAGVPAAAIAERRQAQGGTWIVYLGRFADSQTWQQKADELGKLDVKFDRVNTPTTLAPGLSLGQFTSQPDAAKKLAELMTQGVHGARIVTLAPPTFLRHLQMRAADPAWHHATGAQRFDSCAPDTIASGT